MPLIRDELVFVQFMHPGSEHQPAGPVMDWNRRAHARKFLVADGRYISGGVARDGPVTFWGEWEPQSRVIETFGHNGAGPRWLHDPFWERPRHRNLLQNTDPLVFGERFMYTNCLQWNGKLRRLAPGSVVAFGSRLSGAFILDTVFVVGPGAVAYTRGSADKLLAPDWIRAVVFEPLAASAGPAVEPFRRYEGQMYEDAPDGPFSFVPCRPYGVGQVTFARPVIELERRWIAPGFGRGARTAVASAGELRTVWGLIAEQVVSAGLALGVRFAAPSEVRPEPTVPSANGPGKP